MSSYFGVAISTELIVVFHRESKGIIFFKTAPGIELDVKLLEDLKRAISFDEIELPTTEGEISQASLKGKYVVIRAGRLTYVAVIINSKPNRFTREALHSFTIRLESRWGKELKKLYDELKGDVSVFHKSTETRASVDDLIEEVFHLSLNLPHKLGLPMKKIKNKLTRAVWEIAEEMARGKGYIFLGDLMEEAKNRMSHQAPYIQDSIFELVSNGWLIPIPLDEFVKKYAAEISG